VGSFESGGTHSVSIKSGEILPSRETNYFAGRTLRRRVRDTPSGYGKKGNVLKLSRDEF